MRKQYRKITSPPLAVCLHPSSLGATKHTNGANKNTNAIRKHWYHKNVITFFTLNEKETNLY
jgi:hypothetical protein